MATYDNGSDDPVRRGSYFDDEDDRDPELAGIEAPELEFDEMGLELEAIGGTGEDGWAGDVACKCFTLPPLFCGQSWKRTKVSAAVVRVNNFILHPYSHSTSESRAVLPTAPPVFFLLPLGREPGLEGVSQSSVHRIPPCTVDHFSFFPFYHEAVSSKPPKEVWAAAISLSAAALLESLLAGTI